MLRLISKSSLLSRLQLRGARYVSSAQMSSLQNSSPTTEMRQNTAIDPTALWKYLRNSGLKGFDDDRKCVMKQFAHGQSNPTFMVTSSDGLAYTVRKQPPGKLLPGAHAVDREYEVMTALGHTTVPVPKTRLFCGDSDVIGSPFYVYDFVDGIFEKRGSIPSAQSNEQRTRMYESLIDTLARIHTVDIDRIGLMNYGKRRKEGDDVTKTGYIARQIKTWSRNYKSTETENISHMNVLIKELPHELPASSEERTCLVHGDYRIDNVIFDRDSNEIAAVLDWELSTLGDGLADLAYFCLPHTFPSTSPVLPGMAGIDLNAIGIPSISEVCSLYCDRFNKYAATSTAEIPLLDKREVEQTLNYYLAFSMFRSASICQGVYKRSLMGNASSADAGENFLTFTKNSAKNAIDCLEIFKSTKTTLGTFAPNNTPSSGRDKGEEPKNRDESKLRIPPLFRDSGLISERAIDTIQRVDKFIVEHIIPREKSILEHSYESDSNRRWKIHDLVEELKNKAKSDNLWNLFLPQETDQGRFGAGFTNLEYAFMAELMGQSMIAPEIFNCAAPDTGNMEVIARYGTPKQQEEWLRPLLDGTIRSCFAMTEPAVASSDATNIASTIRVDGDFAYLNGVKWWTSGAMDPRCKIMIFMGVKDGDLSTTPRHQRHSMVLVPMDTEGVEVIRPLRVFGFDDAPHGHAEIKFSNVRVPKENILLGEGRGFEIAQGRLGPGRIHHCMRLLGASERAVKLMCERVTERVAFGKPLAEQGSILMDIANSRVELDSTRLLCLNAAHHMDVAGNKSAKDDIAAIKIAAPRMAKSIIDRAIQVHGGMGLSQDTPLAHLFATARTLQFADGPDEVHMTALAKSEIRNHVPNYKKK